MSKELDRLIRAALPTEYNTRKMQRFVEQQREGVIRNEVELAAEVQKAEALIEAKTRVTRTAEMELAMLDRDRQLLSGTGVSELGQIQMAQLQNETAEEMRKIIRRL